MVSGNEETSEGDGVMIPAAPVAPDQLQTRASNSVFKSGYLFISSKGIGWTSWKKRWFILTRTSLVFFRSDPNALPQKGTEVNLTLGGIDLNSSGSVVVRADKKLLTVLFPDGRDGRAFTLKAETSEDLYEWKAALEIALAQAPTATLVMGQSGIFRNDVVETTEESFDRCILEQWKDKRPANSAVVGRPVLLALEEIDGTPSFLEKALRFIEECGIKVEGILRQSADVEEVKRRVQEYEQGKDEFSPDEDAHVVADCVKHVLRELPSSPVPASCCSSLLEAFRSERASRIHAMRSVISDTFPEPNRLLLQRILKMMRTVVSHKAENRMSTSAVAACMAPLLLRPLLAGDCQFDDDFHLSGDGSLQLLQAAAAANHAQAIIIILLEEYHNIFSNEPLSPELYSDSEGCYTEEEEFTDDEYREDDGYEYAENDIDSETENDHEHSMSESFSERSANEGSDCYSRKDFGGQDATSSYVTEKRRPFKGEVGPWPPPINDFEIVDLGTESPRVDDGLDADKKSSSEQDNPLPENDVEQNGTNLKRQTDNCSSISMADCGDSCENHSVSVLPVELHASLKIIPTSEHLNTKSAKLGKSSSNRKSLKKSNNAPIARRPAIWGRTSARKNLSMESIDLSGEDEVAIQKLEISKTDLQRKIAKEADENAVLQTSLERRKQALRDRRLALEQEVLRLQEQLQKERELRAALEAGLGMPAGECSSVSFDIDSKTREELEEVAQAESDVIKLKAKVSNLHEQLNQQAQSNRRCESCGHNYSNSSSRLTQNIELKSVESSTRKVDALPPVECDAVMKQDQTTIRNVTSVQKQQTSFSSGNNSRLSEAKFLPPKKHTKLSNTKSPKFTDSTSGSTNKAVSQKLLASGGSVNGLKSVDTENAATKDKDQPSLKSKMQQSNSSSENISPKSSAQVIGPYGEETSDAVFDTSAGLFMEETVTDTSAPTKKIKGVNISPSNEESPTSAPASASKKSTGRTEGQTASSALTRLTNRFNFRRERRTSSTELPSTDPPGNTPNSEATAPVRTNSR